MALFEQFPYTNYHEMNLDWIINKLKEIQSNAVISVNGQTGEVILYQDPNVEFPAIDEVSWQIFRTTNGTKLGVSFFNGKMYVVNGNTLDEIYTASSVPVRSVNGKTGDVVLYQDAGGGVRFPDAEENYMNIRREIDSEGTAAIVGLEVDKTKVTRMNGTARKTIYDEDNQPPYPVTSVNGSTGAVMLAIPFNAPLSSDTWTATNASEIDRWGIQRNTNAGMVKAFYVANTVDGKADAYVEFTPTGGSAVTKKLLTIDDIPSSSGVVSVNGQTAVVVLYASDITMDVNDPDTVLDVLNEKESIESVAIPVIGNSAGVNVKKGDFLSVHQSTISGVSDGMYIATQAITANTTITSAMLDNSITALGGMNGLKSMIPDTIILKQGVNNLAKIAGVGFTSTSGYYYVCFIPCDVSQISGVSSLSVDSMIVRLSAGTNPTFNTYTLHAYTLYSNGIRVEIQTNVVAPADSRGRVIYFELTNLSLTCV